MCYIHKNIFGAPHVKSFYQKFCHFFSAYFTNLINKNWPTAS